MVINHCSELMGIGNLGQRSHQVAARCCESAAGLCFLGKVVVQTCHRRFHNLPKILKGFWLSSFTFREPQPLGNQVLKNLPNYILSSFNGVT